MTRIAFVRPGDGEDSRAWAVWSDQLRRRVPAGTPVADITGAEATRSTIDALLAQQPDRLLWFGHGRDDALTADGQPLIDAVNVGALAGGVLIAMACESALKLGRDAVAEQGVRAYVGFDDRVGWPAAAPAPIGQAVVGGLDCLLTKRHQVDCGADELRAGFAAARRAYEDHGTSQYGLTAGEAQNAWLWAKSNGGSVRVLGDGTATIT